MVVGSSGFKISHQNRGVGMVEFSRRSVALSASALMALCACGEGEQTPGEVAEEGVESVTFHRDLRPVLEARCNGCHDGSGITPDALDFRDPVQVQALAPVITAAVVGRTMPPWQASGGCNEYKDDLSLSASEIATFVDWEAEGLKLGDPADFVMPDLRPSELGAERLPSEPTLTIRSASPYTPDKSRPDDFRCFAVDPGFEADRFLQGFEVEVDNVSVLHHIVVFAVPGDEETGQLLAELEAEDETPGYSCFGDSRTNVETLAAVWAPGGEKTAFPPGTGLRISKGARFVMQMHYNLSQGGDGQDNSGIKLWFAPEDSPPAREAEMVFIGNLPFEIPSGVNGGTSQSCEGVYALLDDTSMPLTEGINEENLEDPSEIGSGGCVQQDFLYTLTGAEPVEAHAVFPHMHLKGTHIRAEFVPLEIDGEHSRPAPGAEVCLLDTDRWDFDWQRFYWFQQPVKAPVRGSVRLTCRYDTRGASEAVSLGEGSGDEMCLVLLFLTGTR